MSTTETPKAQAAKAQAAKPVTFDHLKSMKKPVTKTVRICLNSELSQALSEVEAELQMAEVEAQELPSEETARHLEEVKAHHEAARAAATEQSVKFVFRSIGRKTYERLVRENPPTEQQREEAKVRGDDPDDLDWDSDRFPPILVAATLVDPEFTEEQVFEIFNSDDWSSTELSILYVTAQEAQMANTIISVLGKG
jgi:hypothetical protein